MLLNCCYINIIKNTQTATFVQQEKINLSLGSKRNNTTTGYSCLNYFSVWWLSYFLAAAAPMANLLTLTKYMGYDPGASSERPVGAGIDNGLYPAAKVTSVGLNLKF